MNHRKAGFNYLKGYGLEIGAMHNPSPLPEGCRTEYLDVMSKAQLMELFKEVDPALIVNPDYLGDIDKDGLAQFENEKFDYVILNHVIEHLANPIKAVREIFRIVKRSGFVVISCPDKRFTFDKERNLTTFDHLFEEFANNVNDVTDDHYIDFLSNVHPHIMNLPADQIRIHLEMVRKRREHVHVWDSLSFKDFLNRCLSLFKIDATCVYESDGDSNKFEYFSVWRRN